MAPGRLRHFVLWSYEDKGLLLAGIASLGVLTILAGMFIVQNLPATEAYTDHAILRQGIRSVELFLLGSLALAAVFFVFLWRRDREPAILSAFLHTALFIFLAEMFYVLYLVGFLSAGILVIVTTVCITRFAYDRRLGGFVLALSFAGILGLTALFAMGIVPYAPLFRGGNGSMYRYPLVLWAGCAGVMVVLGLLYGMLDFMVGRMHDLSTTDGLTDIANRRHFMTVFKAEYQRAARHKRALSMLIIDVDHFKHVNDTHGHLVGDAVLREVARLVKAELRSYDLVARFGGEEFAVLLPETDETAALQIAERCRERVHAAPLTSGDIRVPVTVSVGVACLTGAAPIDSVDALTSLADTALYRAKQGGRNRVVMA